MFIFGMALLRNGLFSLSGDSLKEWISKFTDTHWKAMLAGIVITCILQSSSAVMIITIGLISTGMFTFRQSIGIILGTNIGTTITTELITFNIQSLLIPLLVVAILLLFMRKKKLQSIGLVLLGICFVFTAMGGFESLARLLKEIGLIEQLLQKLNQSHFLSVSAGIVITGIIQSSTATVGMIMGFLANGGLNIGSGIAIMLGSNIGTCVDAFLAALGGGREARLTAYAHIWLNVIGVIAFYPFIDLLSGIGEQLAQSPEVQLAHISVLFNVLCSLAMLPFANLFARFVLKIHDS